MQKSAGGIGLREAVPVVAGMGDGGLAASGFGCWNAKRCRELGEPETASSTKDLWRVTCWWKAFGAVEALSLHGLVVEPVLARWKRRLRQSVGETDVRATALSASVVVTGHIGLARLSGEVGRMT